MSDPATVHELIHYPVKGCAGTSVREASMTFAGLAHDRSFMVVDPDGAFRSQRQYPRMAVIRPAVSADGTRLTLRAPGLDAVHVDVGLTAARCDVTLFGKPYTGIDQGDAAAEWLSEMLGAPSRLVRVPPEHHRVTDGQTAGTAGFADGAAVLLTSLSSLDLLNERIATGWGGRPLPMTRFRPNIVVSGWADPHTEDQVRRVIVGGAELSYAKLAIRCVVTTVDQATGTKAGPEPLRTLADYRRTADGVAFGVTFAVTRPGRVAVGDELSADLLVTAGRRTPPDG